MADKAPDRTDSFSRRQRALSKWGTEEDAGPALMQRGTSSAAESTVPALTDAELIHLRVRVIALENMVMALLAQASPQQLDLAREMATHILPRQGFTPHPLTIHASHQMVDLLERAGHFRAAQVTQPPASQTQPPPLS